MKSSSNNNMCCYICVSVRAGLVLQLRASLPVYVAIKVDAYHCLFLTQLALPVLLLPVLGWLLYVIGFAAFNNRNN